MAVAALHNFELERKAILTQAWLPIHPSFSLAFILTCATCCVIVTDLDSLCTYTFGIIIARNNHRHAKHHNFYHNHNRGNNVTGTLSNESQVFKGLLLTELLL